MTDLPTVGGRPVRPQINKDFGETVAVMLTISSPKVSDFEIHQRAEEHPRGAGGVPRAAAPSRIAATASTAVLVYPNTVGRSYVLWLGQSLLQRLTEKGLIEDGHIVEAAQHRLPRFPIGRRQDRRGADPRRRCAGSATRSARACRTPTCGRASLVRDLDTLEAETAPARRCDPLGGPDRYSYRELRRFADLIRDRLKQYPTVGKIDEIGVQDEAIYLYYSSRRFSALDLAPQTVAARLERRNINLPGGRVETPEQNVVVHPSGEFKSEQEVGEVVMDVQRGYPTYLRDLVDIVRGYEDPPGVMNFRSVKVDADDPPEAKMPGELTLACWATATKTGRCRRTPKLQTTRAITLAVRQIKGSHIDEFARDVDAALTSLKGVLPDDLQIERTHNEPKEVQREDPAVRPEPDRGGGDRGAGGAAVHGMAQRAAGGRLHSAHRGHDARHSASCWASTCSRSRSRR